MKYLYQQLIAFCSLIIVMLLVIGFSFTQLNRNSIEETNFQQLYSYLNSVQKLTARKQQEGASYNQILGSTLEALDDAKTVLESENVDFLLIDSDSHILYPQNSPNRISITLTNEDWDKIRNNQIVKKNFDENIYGEKENTSYVVSSIPENNNIEGALVISQPVKYLDTSMNFLTSNMVKGFFIAAGIAITVSFFMAKFQTKKIASMKKATKEIADGNFDVYIPNKEEDEFDDLAESINQMAVSLKESNEEIERQEERRKQFMADASHEMRTPLTTIKGLLEGLKYHVIPQNQEEKAIDLMQNETERLIRLVNENLDYEKIRTDQVDILIKKFSATKAMKDLLTQLKIKAEAANDELVLLTEEDISVYADYDRFMQIMVNVIQNAIQFTTDGTISIDIKKQEMNTVITISDTGIGMDEDQVKNIWERYYKVDPSRKNTKYGESGLGLSIVQQLVRMHKGTVSVESELGKGSTFTITFPDEEIKESAEE